MGSPCGGPDSPGFPGGGLSELGGTIQAEGPPQPKARRVQWGQVGGLGVGGGDGASFSGPHRPGHGLCAEGNGEAQECEGGGPWSQVGSRRLALAATAGGPGSQEWSDSPRGPRGAAQGQGHDTCAVQVPSGSGCLGSSVATLRPTTATATCPGHSSSGPPSRCSGGASACPASSAASCIAATCALPCTHRP